jgi:uncharacterized protein (DUF58 family)
MIDPDFLDELARFDASLQRRVNAELQGEQRSTEVGEGLTFSDHRRYSPGDDTRLLDWRVYARTDELYIKQFEAERNLTVHVLLDASASMDYGARGGTEDAEERGPTHKFEYGAKLGLGFAALAADEHNDFRFSLFRDTHERIDRNRSTQGEVLALIDRLNETEPDGETDFQRALEDYATTIDSKSLVLVVSDFLGDPDAIEAGLAALSRNDVTLGHVVEPTERDPDVRGEAIVTDPERDARFRTYFGSRLVDRYNDRLTDHIGAIEAAAERLALRHELVDTGQDFFDSFGQVWVE